MIISINNRESVEKFKKSQTIRHLIGGVRLTPRMPEFLLNSIIHLAYVICPFDMNKLNQRFK
jgi:hypothetical protein